jgi:hypothetical protein
LDARTYKGKDGGKGEENNADGSYEVHSLSVKTDEGIGVRTSRKIIQVAVLGLLQVGYQNCQDNKLGHVKRNI